MSDEGALVDNAEPLDTRSVNDVTVVDTSGHRNSDVTEESSGNRDAKEEECSSHRSNGAAPGHSELTANGHLHENGGQEESLPHSDLSPQASRQNNDVTNKSPLFENGVQSPSSPTSDTQMMPSSPELPQTALRPIESYENGSCNNNMASADKPAHVVVYDTHGAAVHVSPQRQCTQPEPCPVKAKNVKVYFVLSAVCLFLFFPLGVVALYYSLQVRAELQRGARAGTWRMLARYKKRCQNAIIFSFIGFFIALAVAIAAFEQVHYKHNDAYWENRFHHPSAFG